MEIYFFMFSMLLCMAFFDLTTLDNQYKIWLASIGGIILILISGLRWEMGTDWPSYFNFFNFNNTFKDFYEADFEVGFAFLNYLVKLTTDSYSVLLTMMAIFVISIKIRAAFKYSMFPLIAIFINFASITDVFFIRQTIAAAITIIAIEYIIQKNIYKFLFVILLAASIHVSALIFFPSYWIYHLEIKKRYWVIIFVGILLTSNFGLIEKSIYLIISLLYGSDNIFLSKFSFYMEMQSSNNTFVISLIRRAIFIPIYIFAAEYVIDKKDLYRRFLNLVLSGYIIFLLFAQISEEIAVRLCGYYTVYEFILLSAIISVTKNKFLRLLIFILLVIYEAIKYNTSIQSLYDYYVPYRSVFL